MSKKSTVRSLCFSSLSAFAAVALFTGATEAAHLTINTTFDPSIAANDAANLANVESAFNYVVGEYQNLNLPTAVTINITVACVAGTSTLGESSTALTGTFSYASIRSALIANTPADATDLPSTDPITGTHAYIATTAEAKALGLIGASGSSDGTFTFGAGFSYTYSPTNRAVGGEIDFLGVCEHEVSEIMGRIPSLGTNYFGQPDYLPYDLFRFSGNGTRNPTNGSGIYFSMDNGATDLKDFNFPNGNGSDPQDWASGSNDSYNAFSSSSVANTITPVDNLALNAIGYQGTAPEPGTLGLIGAVGVAGLLRRRKTMSLR